MLVRLVLRLCGRARELVVTVVVSSNRLLELPCKLVVQVVLKVLGANVAIGNIS